MKITIRRTRPVVIQLPRELDGSNAEEVAARLRAAYRPGAVVVADMAKTIFCDSLGTRELLSVHYSALESRCELHVARPSGEVLRVWQLLGADRILAIFPTIEAAQAGRRSSRSWNAAFARRSRQSRGFSPVPAQAPEPDTTP